MQTTIKGVIELVATKIASVKIGDDTAIKSVVTKPTASSNSYPYANITAIDGVKTERIDTARNVRIINIKAEVFAEATESGDGPDGGYGKILDIVDAVLTDFDTDKDLSNEVENCMIESVKWGFDAQNKKATATFAIVCAIIVSNV